MHETSFQAMADPTRRKIIHLLGDKEMTAGEIGGHFEISGPSMSHHLAVLKSANLILARKAGQQIFYSLNTTVVQDLLAVIFDLLSPRETPHEN